MFSNYLKIAYRNLKKNKGYSFINITGLVIGLTCFVFIMLWVMNELTYDKFHSKSDHIYRATHELTMGGQTMTNPTGAAPTGPALVADYPEIVDFTRVYFMNRVPVIYEDTRFYEEGGFYVDSSFFKIFTFPLVQGDKDNILKRAYTMVVSEEFADKYFADENPVGKTLTIDGKDFEITGVVQNVPDNSHIKFDFLCSIETMQVENPQLMGFWGQIDFPTYVLLAENTNPDALIAKLPGMVEKYLGEALKKVGVTLVYSLQPLKDIHLYSDFTYNTPYTGNIFNVYLFSGIALFILLIACINFVNLSTARSTKRAKEVGMRKTFGAPREKLIWQFLGESILISVVAMVFTLALLQILLPAFNSLTESGLSLNYFENPWLLPALLGLTVLVGVIAGAYPAFFLSAYKPVRVLKGNLISGKSGSKFRSALVVFQFTISVALVIGTIVIYNQISYMKNKKLGFDKEQMLVIPVNRTNVEHLKSTVAVELASLDGIEDISVSSSVPGKEIMMLNILPEGFEQTENQLLSLIEVDDNFVNTFNMEIVQGRNFSKDIPTDKTQASLINETAAKQFGWENPIGKKISKATGSPQGRIRVETTVIGVVRDFHLTSLHNNIGAMYIENVGTEYPNDPIGTFYLSMKIPSQEINTAIDNLKNKWANLFPDRPFDYFFLDESFNKQYESEERFGHLTLYFCFLAIFIACLGLFGMASYSTEQRTKEIGIRKVLGASVSGIISLISREIIILVIISNIIAWPIAYYLMNIWLENFAYKTSIGIGSFALSGLIALLIAFVTVSYQAIKAATSNPVKSIKYE